MSAFPMAEVNLAAGDAWKTDRERVDIFYPLFRRKNLQQVTSIRTGAAPPRPLRYNSLSRGAALSETTIVLFFTVMARWCLRCRY